MRIVLAGLLLVITASNVLAAPSPQTIEWPREVVENSEAEIDMTEVSEELIVAVLEDYDESGIETIYQVIIEEGKKEAAEAETEEDR